jgi:diguanylate cyclase (GGDEF)-like protein/PAS domain S-box-containing protein
MVHVGVLSPVTGGPFYGDVLVGIVREVAAVGGHVTMIQTMDAGVSGDEVMPAPSITVPIGWDQIDGFIAIAQASSSDYLNRLRAADKPVVITSNIMDDVDAASVVANNYLGVHGAVEHLVGHGHSRIAFVGNLAQTDISERYDGYLAAMTEQGLATQGLHITTQDLIESGGARAAEPLLALPEPVTAVVASTDRLAVGLMQELVARGVRVPQDIAIIGFDNMEVGWHSSPPLATVDQLVSRLGAMAARLLLAELRGEEVEHRRYTVPSHLLPRGSCGCAVGSAASSRQGEFDGNAVALAIATHLRVPLDDDPDATSQNLDDPEVDLDALDDLIETTIAGVYPRAPAPETLIQFTDTLMGMFARVSAATKQSTGTRAEILRHCMSRTALALSRLHAVSGAERVEELSTSLLQQHEVSIELLGEVGGDPSELNWLERVSIRLGCLGEWKGDPEDGLLDITGVYDPAELTTGTRDPKLRVAPTCRVQAFPPAAIVRHVDSARNEVTFVVPVKGASGNHGLLCLVAPVDTHSMTGRATYNQWAALLGVALQQQRLIETVRLSEERYSLAAAATQDGLWDWYVAEGRCYYSDRCQELLGITTAEAVRGHVGWPEQSTPELDPWTLLVHPEDLESLRTELRRAVVTQQPVEVEHRIARPDGEYTWMLCRAQPVGERGQRARRVVGSLSDIHERKELEERLRQAALFDPVTGLPNRRLFLDRLSWAIDQAQRPEGSRYAVVFLDLDRFKDVNDSLGHLMGDELLFAVGERLRAELRSVDTAARFGGDEFAVLLFGLQHEAVLSIVERIQHSIAEPVTLGEHEVSVSASIGIATSDSGYIAAEDVLRDADIAMYNAKETERGTARVFDPVMHTLATGRLRAQSELRTALAEEQFRMHYQPIVALDGSPLTRFEALVRWEHPERGLLPPGEFLPIMDETGSVLVLGHWIIDTVCAQIAEWRGSWDGSLSVSVNLSHREFWSDQLLPIVKDALERHDVPPECLILEITEAIIMADPDAARAVMEGLRDLGVHMHIDDFGTGRSSLPALRAFPVDALKIDRSFVREIDVDAQSTELVRVIVGMGLTLGLDVVAEGVETNEQAGQLQSMGCRTAQGWLYAAALPGDEAGRLIGQAVLPKSQSAVES